MCRDLPVGRECVRIVVPPAISQAISAAKWLAPKSQFQPRFQVDDPCPDLAQKIFHFAFAPNQWLHRAIPPRAEGRFAIVTDVEAGSGGRERSQHSFWECGRTIASRTAKPCGPGAPTLALSSWSAQCALWGDGGKRARSPGRARSKPLKPLRREGRVSSAEPVVLPRAFFLHADHGCQPVPGLPCALSLVEGLRLQSSGAAGAART
jgi:hypothetical protein